MSPAPPAAELANPTQEDGFVRGFSELVGGPLGEHAATRPRDRIWTPARIVILLALLVFCVGWIQKAPCQNAAWDNNKQYTHFCYSDIIALYGADHLVEGSVPYFGWAGPEYPVLTGAFMGVLGLPVHEFGVRDKGLNQYQAFYNLNALVLCTFGLAAIAVVLGLRRRRPWDGAMFALAPALLVTATVNWDLFVVGLTAFFFYAWARRRPVLAGVLLGLAVAAKFYPFLIVGPLLVLALRTWRWRAAGITVGIAALTWTLVNAPVYLWAHDGWIRFWSLNSERQIDWGTFWYIGTHLPNTRSANGGIEPFTSLGANIPLLNNVTYILLGLGCIGVLVLALKAPQRPRLAQLCFIVVALFLLTSKVWSQQFVLWLIPLAVLARPRWGAFLTWQLAEIGYFLAFYAQMLNMSGTFVIPEGTFVMAAAFRWATVATLVGFVVRDILRPENDVVRHTYDGEDPDGGDFGGAPDDGFDHLARISAWIKEKYGTAKQRVLPTSS
jgi:uncharacterized membrane protein